MTKTSSTSSVEKHFNKIAIDYDYYKKKNSFYYDNLKYFLKQEIPNKALVLEIGCGTGDLLASLNPKVGYGMDISGEMIKIAKAKHKSKNNLIFSTKFSKAKFDYIFMSDVIEHLEKPQNIFIAASNLMNKKSKFIITMANPVWEPMLMLAEKFGLKMPEGPHNRIGYKDMIILGKNAGMIIVKHNYRLLIPVNIPLISEFVNRYLEKYFKRFCFIEYFVLEKKLLR
jgi:2-polyprenyl-3-methyl-5-hydroxy-6-metoxy-1,4-benzoquinol methylase